MNLTVLGVALETAIEGGSTGWAVYTRCEGDDPLFVAFFPKRAHAAAFVSWGMEDPDDDGWLGPDGDVQIVPAVLASDGSIIAANDSDAEGMRALSAGVLGNSDARWM